MRDLITTTLCNIDSNTKYRYFWFNGSGFANTFIMDLIIININQKCIRFDRRDIWLNVPNCDYLALCKFKVDINNNLNKYIEYLIKDFSVKE